MSGVFVGQGEPLAHIVATGVRCPVGLDSASAAAAVRAQVSLLAEHPSLVDCEREKVLCGREPTLDPEMPAALRIAHLSTACLRQIVASPIFADMPSPEVHILMALPESRPGFSDQDAIGVQQTLASFQRGHWSSLAVTRVGTGHAGALLAMRTAIDVVLAGRAGFVIVGGADSYIDARTIAWLDERRLLARDNVRTGFQPGEGAAFVAIASESMRDRLGLESLAEIRGIACSHEMRDPNSDVGLLGEALAQAVIEATRSLQLPQELVTDLYGDLNGERGRTEDWGFTLLRASSRFRDGTDYVSAVSLCGDLGAATGTLGSVLASEAWRMGRAQGRLALVWAGSWAGLRGALVLQSPKT